MWGPGKWLGGIFNGRKLILGGFLEAVIYYETVIPEFKKKCKNLMKLQKH